MKFFMVNDNGTTQAYEFPDDFRMDELFCELNHIGEDVSDDEVHRRMSESHDSLTTKNGNFIRFADHANSDTTLAQLGINENTEYRLDHNFATESGNGAYGEEVTC